MLLFSQGNKYEIPAFDVAVRDTTGAGDAFYGGFVFARYKRFPLEECLVVASAVAAIKCTGIGARESLPTLSVLHQFMAERGFSELSAKLMLNITS